MSRPTSAGMTTRSSTRSIHRSRPIGPGCSITTSSRVATTARRIRATSRRRTRGLLPNSWLDHRTGRTGRGCRRRIVQVVAKDPTASGRRSWPRRSCLPSVLRCTSTLRALPMWSRPTPRPPHGRGGRRPSHRDPRRIPGPMPVNCRRQFHSTSTPNRLTTRVHARRAQSIPTALTTDLDV